jgi:16S rRNA (adenine(1408)-N(1))-methyltransferase
METIRGRTSFELDLKGLQERLAGYNRILLDLGTGDGRYVRNLAKRHPNWFVIGVDACRENLREHSRAKLPNMLFIIAEARHLPRELAGRVSQLTINFPWGSLLEGLLTSDPALMNGLASVSRPVTAMEVRLNGGALAEAGWSLETGAQQIQDNLLRSGWQVDPPGTMDASSLQTFPTTWARRLAHGRDPHALAISGWLANQPYNIEQPA